MTQGTDRSFMTEPAAGTSMTTKTMAHGVTARTPHEVAKATESGFVPSSLRRGVLYTFVLTGLAGLQVLTAGPAAVATIPTQVRIREAAAPVLPPEQLAIVPRAPGLVASILDEAFPSLRSGSEIASILDEAFPSRKAVHSVEGTENAGGPPEDPNELMSFGGRRAPR